MKSLEMIRAEISALEADIASPERITLRLQSLGRLWRDAHDIAQERKRTYLDFKERANNLRPLLAKAREDEGHVVALQEQLAKQREHAESVQAGILASGHVADHPISRRSKKTEAIQVPYSIAVAMTKAPGFPADFGIHLLRAMGGNGATFQEAIIVAAKMTGKNPLASLMPPPPKARKKTEKQKRTGSSRGFHQEYVE